MALESAILVGTPGQGVFRSANEGESWVRGSIGQGLHSDAIIRSLAVHPDQPRTVYAGSDKGLYRSDDAGASWNLLETPMNNQAIWQIVFDPRDSQIMLAGTGTPNVPALFRSNDGGATWRPDQVEIARECPAVGVPRPTGIAFDPSDSSTVWLGLEVDGMRRTQDGGKRWETTAEAIHNMDVHNVAATAGPPKTIFVLVNNDIWTSTDDGESWQPMKVREKFAPFGYPRGITVKPDDPRVVYITLGDATPGRMGTVLRSDDTGNTWEQLPLSSPSNSAMWVVHIPKSQSKTVFAGSRYGYLYRSEDGGEHFEKQWREFSEISSIAYIPG
jgi:photosystem II stability/assembly factor-like uncharacterized protein